MNNTKPSLGALDFARRHNLPEPRTATEAVEVMRRVIGLPRWGELWTEADEERMDVIGQNGNDGLAYTGHTTQPTDSDYNVKDDNNGRSEDE